MASDERPILEVRRGSRSASVGLACVCGTIVVGLLLLSMRFRIDTWRETLSWLPTPLAKHPHELWLAFLIAAVVVFLPVWFGLMAYFEVRLGHARFYADRVELEKFVVTSPGRLRALHVLPWGELAGFRDGSASHVGLVRKRSRLLDRVTLTIPTPTPEVRELLLKDLVDRGLPRIH